MFIFGANLVKRKRLLASFVCNIRSKSKKSQIQMNTNATASATGNYSATLNLPKPLGFELSMKNICQLEEKIRSVLYI
jgi:hypothetical protein